MNSKAKSGKRKGRPPKPPGTARRETIGLRLRAFIKARLQEAAAKNQRSFGEEAEARLEKSLSGPIYNLTDFPGGNAAFELLCLLGPVIQGAAMRSVERSGGRVDPEHWGRDPQCYEDVCAAVMSALDTFRPLDLSKAEVQRA